MWRNRDIVLGYSRSLGWLLGFLVVAAAFMVVIQFRAELQVKNAHGEAEKQAFLIKVRACVHQPGIPRHGWTECELKVRAGE